MPYIGSIKCPNCKSPIDDEVDVCPYCFSHSPATAPWRQGSWTNVLILALAIGVLWGVDQAFDTGILKSLWNMLDEN